MDTAKRPLILLLDSNQNSAFIMQKRLGNFGFDTEMFSNPESVVEYLNHPQRTPDLVLVDIIHPHPKIMDLPEEIRQKTKWGKMIPLAVCTSISDRSIIPQCIRRGYSDYLIRPMEADIFKDRLKKLIDRAPELDQRYTKKTEEISTVELEITVSRVSEFELHILSDIKVPAGTMLKIRSAVFEKMNIDPLNARVIHCQENSEGQKHELILSYVGLSAAQLREIRKYVMYPGEMAKAA